MNRITKLVDCLTTDATEFAKGFARAKEAIQQFAKAATTQNRFELNRHERRKAEAKGRK